MISFEPHPNLPHRIVARSERGAHLANIISREGGRWYEVKPYVQWIDVHVFESVEAAQAYILSCAQKSNEAQP
jgi:hypothetical protein